jgi:hypothetical protein
MSPSYYAGPPLQAIPAQLANLLPNRPVVLSGSTGSWNISPPISGSLTGSFSVGKKAKFYLLPGATQNVLWATTRDIDSLGAGQYQTINAVFSFNDSSGITGPTLLRTLHWGTLEPPTRPIAFTFIT